MARRYWVFGLVWLVIALSFPDSGLAGTTGKVQGWVRDRTGTPLPGANVVIEGVGRSGVANQTGSFFILNLEPGIYRVTASLIGYDKLTRQEVQVAADRTTIVDFALNETALQMSEVVKTAERSLVDQDKTTSQYVMAAGEIEKIGVVRSTQDLLQLQPGVSLDGRNAIRGSFVEAVGYGTDVAYVIDGIRMNYNDGRGKGGTFQSVNRGAIQEISVLTGVTPAEYGNAQSGVVNIVTKQGDSEVHGWVEGRFEPASQKHWGANVYDAPQHLDHNRWKDPTWTNERNPATGKLIHQRSDYTRWNGWQVEGNASGPVGDKASFVVSARHDRLAAPTPGPTRTGFYDEQSRFVSSGPDNIALSGSFTVKPSANLKLKVGGLFQRWNYYSNGQDDVYSSGTGTVQLLPGIVRGLGDNGRDLFLPENWSAAGIQKPREELEYAVLTHTLNSCTFYEIRLSRSVSFMDTASVATVTSPNLQDVDKWYNLGRPGAARFRLYDRQRRTLKADLSSQLTKGHFMKAGLELIRGSMWLTQFVHNDPSERRIYLYADKLTPGKPVHPIFVNAYAQDKMEFEGMIVNAGIRMDAFSPNVRTQQHEAYSGTPMFRMFSRARDYLYDGQSIWSVDAPWQVVFSPRIGISHPITSKAQIRFSSGVFYQFADMFFYYGKDFRSFGRKDDVDINKNGKIDDTESNNNMETTYAGLNGSVLLRPAKATSFEVGADWNFITDYTMALTTYYKSEVDQFTTYPSYSWQGAYDRSVIYARTIGNGAYADTRGIELALKKAISHGFAFQVSYAMQWSIFATGKVANITQNVFMDSVAVATLSQSGYTKTFPDGQQVFVPDFWVDMTPSSTGREIPVKMTVADIRKYGARAQANLNSARSYGALYAQLGPGFYDGVYPMAGQIGTKGLYTMTGGYIAGARDPKPGDRRNYGSLTLLLSLPENYKLGPAFVGNLLSNLRMTAINRLETGALSYYTPVQGGAPSWTERGMDTRTDVAIEKTFRAKGRCKPTFFADVRNLFNQKDRTTPSNVSDYLYWGVDGPRIDDLNYQKYGDVNDRNYAGFPRRWNVGMRLNW